MQCCRVPAEVLHWPTRSGKCNAGPQSCCEPPLIARRLPTVQPEQMLKPAAGTAALGVPAGVGADGDAAGAVLATYTAQQPSLSIVKGWDALNLLAAPVRRRKGQASLVSQGGSSHQAGCPVRSSIRVHWPWCAACSLSGAAPSCLLCSSLRCERLSFDSVEGGPSVRGRRLWRQQAGALLRR